jgi:hypothetical protein
VADIQTVVRFPVSGRYVCHALVFVSRITDRAGNHVELAIAHNEGSDMSLPRISLMLVILLALAYVVGAKYPVLAQKIGIA